MKKFATALLAMLAIAALAAGPALAQSVLINEIRIDQPGTDVDEYFELAGAPGTPLTGYHYIVIGDGTPSCGTIEAVIDLSPYSIQGDGLLAIVDGDGVPTLAGYDVFLGPGSLNFENSDNVTHMLVTGFTGALTDDIDADNDGVIDFAPWATVEDAVGLYEGTVFDCAVGNEYLYSTTIVGPDGSFVPGHVYRCGAAWAIGPFDPSIGSDTPGSANDCATPAETSTWGRVKVLYR